MQKLKLHSLKYYAGKVLIDLPINIIQHVLAFIFIVPFIIPVVILIYFSFPKDKTLDETYAEMSR